MRRRLQTDLAGSGINKRFGVRVLSSEHDADPGDAKNVDRVVIGGTIEETGLPTLGVTSSIDPGNFDTSDASIVLLDLLSGPADDTISLNHYMKPSSDRITFISTVVSHLVSHEIGHALGTRPPTGRPRSWTTTVRSSAWVPTASAAPPTTPFRRPSEPMPSPTWTG
ncbi:hypothetical protein AB0M11_33775 [Streptomyces sp. NPDC051987]|uniref:hypothetical protein n=1 Tax=Streptomyces sp. NPDC051987 TaxID=3155808 RepID=UPI0034246F44